MFFEKLVEFSSVLVCFFSFGVLHNLEGSMLILPKQSSL